MPYIKQHQRDECLENGLADFLTYLLTVSVENRKGFVAYAVEYLGKHSFGQNYFGLSTGTDAVRSAYNEMEKDLAAYEAKKRLENGDV